MSCRIRLESAAGITLADEPLVSDGQPEPSIDPHGVPICSEACSAHDVDAGGWCALLGSRPGRVCEPHVRTMAQMVNVQQRALHDALSDTAVFTGMERPYGTHAIVAHVEKCAKVGFVREHHESGSLREETRAALDTLADGPDVGRMLAQSHERGGKEACALVRQLMGEHGVDLMDPGGPSGYEPGIEALDRLPAMVTALWRLTEPRVDPPTEAGSSGVADGLEGAAWEGDDLRLRDGRLLVPNGGSGSGATFGPTYRDECPSGSRCLGGCYQGEHCRNEVEREQQEARDI